MNLLVVSHVPHKQMNGQLHAYGPYARELEMWADLFPEVTIAAPSASSAGGDAEPIRRSNVVLAPQPDVGAVTGVRRVIRTMRAVVTLSSAMMRASAIHVRCPGNLGLLGALLAPFFSRRLVAKYAGSWPDYPGEPFTYRLQKRILRARWWRGPVTVYGEWPEEPRHVIPFFTAAMDRSQLQAASDLAASRSPSDRLRLLYVGRLSEAKNVDVVIEAVADLRSKGVLLSCVIAGSGPQDQKLKLLARELGCEQDVEFLGAVPLDDMPKVYSSSDALVLVSRSEGWPKAMAEAMAFGLVCIGSDQGLVPQILSDGRGICVPPGDKSTLCHALLDLANHPEKRIAMAESASVWARAFALEDLREAIKGLIEEKWKVRLDAEA